VPAAADTLDAIRGWGVDACRYGPLYGRLSGYEYGRAAPIDGTCIDYARSGNDYARLDPAD